MDLKVLSVHGHGDFDKEYVVLRVLKSCDLGDFLLADSTFLKDGMASNKLRHLYWFLEKRVEANEFVILYTRAGKNNETTTDEGVRVHHCFWGLEVPVWNDEKDCAILIKAQAWTLSKTR